MSGRVAGTMVVVLVCVVLVLATLDIGGGACSGSGGISPLPLLPVTSFSFCILVIHCGHIIFLLKYSLNIYRVEAKSSG